MKAQTQHANLLGLLSPLKSSLGLLALLGLLSPLKSSLGLLALLGLLSLFFRSSCEGELDRYRGAGESLVAGDSLSAEGPFMLEASTIAHCWRRHQHQMLKWFYQGHVV